MLEQTREITECVFSVLLISVTMFFIMLLGGN